MHPTRFMLLAATNPCLCGHAGDGDACRCSKAELAKHRRKLSGPLLDRIDLPIDVRRETLGFGGLTAHTTSRQARERVLAAREIQARRMRAAPTLLNAELPAAALRRHATPDAAGQRLLDAACMEGRLSGRGAHRVLRLARTIADLEGRPRIGAPHVGRALELRAGRPLQAEPGAHPGPRRRRR